MAGDERTDDKNDTQTDDEVEQQAEARYRRRVGVTLATLAMVGAWIGLLQTDASTNESSTTRQATRLASEAQTADVVARGARSGLNQVEAEIEVFGSRPAFDLVPQAVAEAGGTLDPDRDAARLEAAIAELESALVADEARVTELAVVARRLSLVQAAVVEERITWNARASQYETVITTLAVAIFLVGFTLAVGRRERPPFAVPGLVLAAFCFGWALHIYTKPIPDVDRTSIEATAAGEVALEQRRSDDAVGLFEAAVDLDSDYPEAQGGLGLARLAVANPDVLTTFAITDDSPDVIAASAGPIETALASGGDDQADILASAALVAIVAADWDLAADRLEQAIDRNQRTPGLELALAAVAVALGDQQLAATSIDRAVEQLAPEAGSDTNRATVSRYLTLLEWVGFREPDRQVAADEARDRAMALIASTAPEGGEPSPLDDAAPSDVRPTLEVGTVSFDDGHTALELDVEGVSEGDHLLVAGYERPAPGAAWVQPAELFYVGPPGDAGGMRLATPRGCVPVEYRFDLYVNGSFADSVTAPGGSPTC